MPLEISRNDIRNVRADAIVNPTDHFYTGLGGTDGIIHEMAGKRLREHCDSLPFLETGEAILTPSYDCRHCGHIIHTCGPVYVDGERGEREYLAECYQNCLDIALKEGLSSIAFPLISSGTFSFPKGEALHIATEEITSFLLDHEMDVTLLVYDKEAFDTASRLFVNIKDYLKENYTGPDIPEEGMPSFKPAESFSQALIRLIDEKGYKDPDVYKRANISRKHFSHIVNDVSYRPKKETAVALAIGLRLTREETDSLLEKAGYILSSSSRFDLIISYCLKNGIYNIYKINEILYEEGEKTLGC